MADIRPSLALLVKLAKHLLDPEMFGYAVTREVRDEARKALGIAPCELPKRKQFAQLRAAIGEVKEGHSDPAHRLTAQAKDGLRMFDTITLLANDGARATLRVSRPRTYRDLFGCDAKYGPENHCPFHGDPDRSLDR